MDHHIHSFVALAMLAGFGSLEFFQRLKETALTLFGQKVGKTKWEKIQEFFALYKAGVITEEEFIRLKNDGLRNSIDLESKNLKLPSSQGNLFFTNQTFVKWLRKLILNFHSPHFQKPLSERIG